MRTRSKLAYAVCVVALFAPPAQAAMLVHDPVNYAELIEQARTALSQLEELKAQVEQGKALFDSLNGASGVNQIASQLGLESLRAFLPQLSALQAAADGDLSSLGAIGARAQAIRAARRIFQPEPHQAQGADLEATGLRAARDLALAEAVAAAGADRLTGLRSLQTALSSAESARAVLDLSARTSAEQALIANDQMRLQGLAMTQAAEARLERQAEAERAAAARAARMAMLREAFQ